MGIGHLYHMPSSIAVVFQCRCWDKGGGVSTHYRQFAIHKNRVMATARDIKIGQALGYYFLYSIAITHFRLGTLR